MLKKIVSKNLKTLRTKAGLSQANLAALTKPQLSVRYISRLENQAPNVTLDVIETLSKALECNPEDLVQQRSHGKTPKKVTDEIEQAIRLLKSVKSELTDD